MSNYGMKNGEKPCRACSDFKTWMKTDHKQSNPNKPADSSDVNNTQAKQQDGSNSSELASSKESTTAERDQSISDQAAGVCPPDRLELGASTWSFLHTLAAYFPSEPSPVQQEDAKQLMHIVSRLYPCADCADDLKKDLILEPPQVGSAIQFSQWMCRLHNKVNTKLGKPLFDCSRVFERWRDGWKDGSCD